MIGADAGDYALRVRGDSMRDAGILEGDYVVVHPAEDADNGQIVVAMIEDEATVKRFFREGKQVRLQPETRFFPIIPRTQRVSEGIGVFRKGDRMSTSHTAERRRPQEAAGPGAVRPGSKRGARPTPRRSWSQHGELVDSGRLVPVGGSSDTRGVEDAVTYGLERRPRPAAL